MHTLAIMQWEIWYIKFVPSFGIPLVQDACNYLIDIMTVLIWERVGTRFAKKTLCTCIFHYEINIDTYFFKNA